MGNDGWKTHGRVDAAIPEAKLKEFLKAGPPKIASSTITPKKKQGTSSDSLSTPEAESQKKTTGGAFGIFQQESKEAIKASQPDGAKFGYIVHEAASRWRALSEDEKKPFHDKWESKLAAFTTTLSGSKGSFKKLKKTKEDSRLLNPEGEAIKKPAGGGYGVFTNENRESIKASLPADHRMVDVTKQAGLIWKGMKEEEKKVYNAKYEVKAAHYKDAIEAAVKVRLAEAPAPGATETTGAPQ